MHRLFSFVLAVVAVFTVPTLVIASAVPESSPASSSSSPHIDDRSHLTLARQDIGSALSDFVELIRTINGFLKPDFFKDIDTVVAGLAAILADPLPAQARGLINTTTDLLGGLGPVLRFISGIDFGSLTDSVSGLFDAQFVKGAVDLVKEVQKLVTPAFVQQVVGVVGDVAPLASAISEFITALIASLIGG